ncbi:scaffold attachment factor B2-like [Biomphalaria glabrata]|uniref:Scaffold attachment factor B2-like n=1 Tax=Biomphalaria glabrata TaxID=6526 RepID=A0A9W3ASR1_BIOGL|nr:scaffold attachment factor B2-like [Biomphalaria glabrata]
MSTSKRIHELQINKIRKELKRRDIAESGNKEALVRCLRDALKEDGFDPDTYKFEMKADLIRMLSEIKEELLGSMRAIATGLKTDLEEFRNIFFFSINLLDWMISDCVKNKFDGLKFEVFFIVDTFSLYVKNTTNIY